MLTVAFLLSLLLFILLVVYGVLEDDLSTRNRIIFQAGMFACAAIMVLVEAKVMK